MLFKVALVSICVYSMFVSFIIIVYGVIPNASDVTWKHVLFLFTGSLAALVYQHSITPLALPCKLVLPESGNNQCVCVCACPCACVYAHACMLNISVIYPVQKNLLV